MLVYYSVPFIVSNRYLLFWVSNGHNSVTFQNRTHVYMNFFDHKDLGNHLLQLCPKVVKHPVYTYIHDTKDNTETYLTHLESSYNFIQLVWRYRQITGHFEHGNEYWGSTGQNFWCPNILLSNGQITTYNKLTEINLIYLNIK